MDLSKKLKSARISNKISQKTLAERLGISRTTLSLWETGKAIPSVAHLRDYQEIFNFEKGYFNDAARDITAENYLSLDVSHLNEKGLSELKKFYNSLCNDKEYLKKP